PPPPPPPTDTTPPVAPIIDPSNGITLKGTAEARSNITLTSRSTTIGPNNPDVPGHWSFTPASALATGATVNATATDAAGNVSQPANVVIDSVAPAAPVIAPTQGVMLNGTAEAGSSIT